MREGCWTLLTRPTERTLPARRLGLAFAGPPGFCSLARSASWRDSHSWPTLFDFTLEKLAVLLGVATVASFGGACNGSSAPARPGADRIQPGAAGRFAADRPDLQLGRDLSTGSGNWPALLLIDLLVLLALSYALNNPLLLILSAVVFFGWFGGFTGYASGWGAYWFGMSYPLRFLAAALAIIAIAVIHQQSERGPLARYRGFFKIWLSGGCSSPKWRCGCCRCSAISIWKAIAGIWAAPPNWGCSTCCGRA